MAAIGAGFFGGALATHMAFPFLAAGFFAAGRAKDIVFFHSHAAVFATALFALAFRRLLLLLLLRGLLLRLLRSLLLFQFFICHVNLLF
jgi:hypothetical protein